MPFTYRLGHAGPLSSAEFDDNLRTVELLHDAAQTAQQSASDSATAAAAAANFKGTWTGKTGAATMPASYSHLGKFWALAVNIPASPGIQSKTPGTAAEFVEIPISGLTAAQMHAATAKATPADADEVPLIDSAASWAIKKLTWGALKTAVKAWLVAQSNTWTAPQTFAGGVVVSGGGLGYGPGAGGTVTQATSKGTSVTLNKLCGKIVLHPEALAANASTAFPFINATITNTDLLSVGVEFAEGMGDRYAARASATAGAAVIYVQNVTTGTLSESPTIVFSVTKGATA